MKTKRKYEAALALSAAVMAFGAGCGSFYDGGKRNNEAAKEIVSEKTENSEIEIQTQKDAESVKLAEGYREIYETAKRENKLDAWEVKKKIVEYLGDKGCTAADVDNQINMENYEQAEAFCKKAEQKQPSEVTIFSVTENGGFVRYDMEANQGKINVQVSSLKWENGIPSVAYHWEYEACTWKYTEKGYLLMEEYHPSGYDGAPGETGFRIKPLDETCRALNQSYVLPTGYRGNKLLITDWNEQDYSSLDFYDLYEVFYRLKYKTNVPYPADYGRAEYEIPKNEFEEVIQTYISVPEEVLKRNTSYDAEKQVYKYRPRGLYDSGYPYEPYPEVTAYEELADGTIKLTVEAVWILKMQDRAFVSEVIVRPLQNGQYRFVSNRVISTQENEAARWYKDRLTEAETETYKIR